MVAEHPTPPQPHQPPPMDSTAGSGIAAPAAAAVCDLRMEPKIPEPFVWPNGDARPASAAELDMPVVDVGVLRDGDAEGLRRAAAQVAAACATHGFFQVSARR
uniref:Putative gibberellin-20 oxidase n=1 Tax=Oryza sativa subsp. indica TaxID=39946 RepID=A0A0D5BWU6_ORYSI|nr:gibberellin-20 oxidase [Oryza sativa Indica Group]AAN73383.1 putative gibberellin 20 oxidase [Oryza sativa Indica Group]AJW67892.1 putative gibberellin-20 oxidase [Oryza sativa Indica Group]ALF35829.1 SD1-2-protein [Oryza sativa Indica Group]ALF35832.1 SD1-2 protein [Oryza sativa Indica Group]